MGRSGRISGRRLPAIPALPPGYSYAPAPQLALPPGYATAGAGQVVVHAPAALPALHGHPATPAPAAVVPAVPVVPARQPGDQMAAAARWSWAHRWGLTPVVAPVAVGIGAAASPGSTTWAAGLTAAGLGVWARRARPVGGRMLLSVRERIIAAVWCATAAAWTPLAAYGPLTPVASGLVLAAGVAWPSGAWWASRRIRPTTAVEEETPALSETARQLIAAWPGTVGVSGPGVLRGSRIDPDTMREPAPGAWACQVELRDDVHAETATGDETRRGLERMLRLPVASVQLATVREDSGRVALTMTPARHLEASEGVAWPGPVMSDDGLIPLAETQDGREVSLALFNESGVEHWWINGAKGGGKTCTSYVLMLPGVMARRQVIIYCDGGRGTSIPPELRPALARVATTPEQWRAAIEAFGAVLTARQERRGARGRHRWLMADGREDDPIITLWLEEATEINRHLGRRWVDMVNLGEEQGRKLGCQVVQVTQGARADLLIGGVPARGNLTSVVAHRPGGGNAARLAMDGTGEDVDLLQLPAAKGWAAIVRDGEVAGFPARVRFAKDEAVAEALAGFVARQLAGADLAAAGPAYLSLPTGPDSIPADDVDENQVHDAGEPAAATVHVVDVRDVDQADTGSDAGDVDQAATEAGRPALYAVPDTTTDDDAGEVDEERGDVELSGPAAVRAANRAAVLEVLRASDEPLPRAEIADRIDLSRPTVTRILREDLAPAGLAEPAGGGTWRALPA